MFHYDRTIIGYHGCDLSVAEALLSGAAAFEPSTNSYDWLGHGVYFWEFGADRAWRFALEQVTRKRIEAPAVIGAVIQLGHCFDLLDTRFTADLEQAFPLFKRGTEEKGLPLPENSGRTPDLKLRHLDCAMLNFYLTAVAETEGSGYDSVRGAFAEGEPAFPGSGFTKEAHVQVSVRNPSCIIGVFRPMFEEQQ